MKKNKNEKLDVLLKRFQNIHEAGPKRHTASWLAANLVAVETLWASGFNPNDLRIKTLTSLIVLRVLDVVEPTIEEGSSDILRKFEDAFHQIWLMRDVCDCETGNHGNGMPVKRRHHFTCCQTWIRPAVEELRTVLNRLHDAADRRRELVKQSSKPCREHELDMDGICKKCGADMRTGRDMSAAATAPRPWRVESTRNGQAWILVAADGEKVALANCTPNARENLELIAAAVNGAEANQDDYPKCIGCQKPAPSWECQNCGMYNEYDDEEEGINTK
jgi:hypothetical protein